MLLTDAHHRCFSSFCAFLSLKGDLRGVWAQECQEYQRITVQNDEKHTLSAPLTLYFSQMWDIPSHSRCWSGNNSSEQLFPFPTGFTWVLSINLTVIPPSSSGNDGIINIYPHWTIGDLPGLGHIPSHSLTFRLSWD